MKQRQILKKGIVFGLILTFVLLYGDSVILAAKEEQNVDAVTSTADAIPANETSVAENEKFSLLVDQETTHFSVVDKKSGKVWNSAPASLSGGSASEELNEAASSLIKVWYYNKQDEENTMQSYTDAVLKEQVNFEPIAQGVRINFVLGSDGSSSVVPKSITEERMQELILNPLDGTRSARRVEVLYRHVSEADAVSEEEFQKDLAKYPILKEKNIYVLNDEVTAREMEELEGIFREAGYTAEMCKQDAAETGQTEKDTNSTPFFKIPLEIVLNDTGFTASINADKIQYNKEYYLYKISLMEYFDALQTGEKGQLFYPDGSGMLISPGVKGVTSVVTSVTKPVYGENCALQPKNAAGVEQSVKLPIWGFLRNQQGTLAVIEQGDAVAQLTATISDEANPYNRNYASFILHDKDQFDFGDWGGVGYKWTVFEKEGYLGKIQVHYSLLSGAQANLGGLASTYRNILLKDRCLKTEASDIPFYLETMGTFNRKDNFLGFTVNRKTVLTTYDQAKEMLDELSKAGVDNLRLKYSGWANGGLAHTAFSSINPEGKLGSRNDLKNFSQALAKAGYAFFPDLDFLFVDKDGIFDAFSTNNHTIRTLDKKYGGLAKQNLSDYLPDEETFRKAVSPDVAYRFAESAQKKLGKYQLSTVSSGSLGESLFSNFSDKRYCNRQTSCDYSKKIAAMMSNQKGFMTSGGNAYLLPYTSDVLSVPSTSSEYSLPHVTVPFIQMVLHGYVDYAGSAINLSGDYRVAVLNAALNGEAAYFVLNYDNTKYLRETRYSQYYSTQYKQWKEDAVNIYQKLNSVLKSVSNQKMTGFEPINEYVYRTQYSNGKSVIVNYGKEQYQDGSVQVAAMDFALIG